MFNGCYKIIKSEGWNGPGVHANTDFEDEELHGGRIQDMGVKPGINKAGNDGWIYYMRGEPPTKNDVKNENIPGGWSNKMSVPEILGIKKSDDGTVEQGNYEKVTIEDDDELHDGIEGTPEV